MKYPFLGKTALVTGASSGIGKATALAFAKNGAQVIIADIADATVTLAEIEALGGKGVFRKTDVSQEEELKELMNYIREEFEELDFAFNNAGIETGACKIEETTSDDWNRIMDINAKGVWLCMKYEIPLMRNAGKGAIVNCASVAGLVGAAGLGVYSASKHAVVGLTKAAALENARKGIRVNAVCPGVIRTPMVERFINGDDKIEQSVVANEPMKRLGLPEEIANTVLFLCSDAASFTTGQAIAVDGGWTTQ